jgi:hypothetical protein
MSGGGGSDTVVQNNDPPEYAQPYLQHALGEAQNQYQTGGPSFYPGSTLAAQSPETLAATGALASRGMTGNPLVQSAQAQQQGTVGGQYLAGNPMQDAVYGNVASKVLPSVTSQFSGAGRYGSNAHQNQLVDQLTSAYAPYASQNYQFERGNQEAAAARSPQFAAEDYRDIAAVGQAGAMRDQYGQQQINADRERFDFAQQSPQDQLARYMALISGGTVGGTSTTEQPSASTVQQLLQGGGLLLGGYGAGVSGGLW